MRNLSHITVCVLLLICASTGLSLAQPVDKARAATIADNYIASVLEHRGRWGAAESAKIVDVAEFKRGNRTLGYYCSVEPTGHIIVSLLEGLAPIKAYSETTSFDPQSDEGMADLLKLRMETILDEVEHKLGSVENIQPGEIDAILELNHKATWSKLAAGPISLETVKSEEDNYEQGLTLLSSAWHQSYPYNVNCPTAPAEAECSDPKCVVGCVATAGAQIMRYWSWPPDFPYSWQVMPDAMEIGPTGDEIEAVAALCYTIGYDAGMTYCSNDECRSSTDTWEMRDVFSAWQYHPTCAVAYRTSYTWDTWFDIIRANINLNRPVQYRILGHSIVCDGWSVASGPSYHMNYGWGGAYDDWYAIDALHQPRDGGGPADEYIVHNIYPTTALGASFSGTLALNPSYPYLYVDQDCSLSNAFFASGFHFTMLSRTIMECTSGYARIDGSPGLASRLYVSEPDRGLRIDDGTILMHERGSITMRNSRPD